MWTRIDLLFLNAMQGGALFHNIKNAAQNAYELRSKHHPSGVQMTLKK